MLGVRHLPDALPDGRHLARHGRGRGGALPPTCPDEALALRHKETSRVPPKTLPALYAKIYEERYGRLGLVAAAARRALGLKV